MKAKHFLSVLFAAVFALGMALPTFSAAEASRSAADSAPAIDSDKTEPWLRGAETHRYNLGSSIE